MNKMENLFGELRLFSLIYIPHTCTLLSSKRKRLEAWFDRLLLWTLFIITPLTFNQNDSTTQRPSFSEKSVLVNESATEWSPSRNDGQNWSQFTFLKSNRADVLSPERWKWVCVPVFDSPVIYTEKNDKRIHRKGNQKCKNNQLGYFLHCGFWTTVVGHILNPLNNDWNESNTVLSYW